MATITVTKGYNNNVGGWISGETVTPEKLNLSQTPTVTVTDIVNADIKTDAAIALSKLATGALPAAITTATANIVDTSITTAKIANANVTPAKLSQPYTLATAQNSTSGTSIDFTGIPSWAKRITVMFNGVSVSASSAFLLQAGTSGGIVATGYSGGGLRYSTTSIAAASFTAGVSPNNSTAGAAYSGHAIWTLVSGNIWTCSLNFGASGGVESGCMAGGSVTLSGALTQVRITTVNGTATFDAGTINISYEG